MLGAPVRWPRPSRLEEPLDVPEGKLADGLRTLGLTSVGALLEHLPRDSREARTVAALKTGEQATVAVQVRRIAARAVRRRGMKPLVEATVFDATGSMRATFFNQPWLAQRYEPGTRLILHGKTTERGTFNVAHHALGSDAVPDASPGATEQPARRDRALSGDRGRELDADPGARPGREGRAGGCTRGAGGGHAGERGAGRSTQRARRDALPARRARSASRAASGWRSRSCC